jgi:hypothetical protein
MRVFSKLIWVVPALVMTATSPAPAQVDADLAKRCRTLMLRAHPVEMYGMTGSAAAQRSYFDECIRKQGDMSEAADSRKNVPQSTVGQGN